MNPKRDAQTHHEWQQSTHELTRLDLHWYAHALVPLRPITVGFLMRRLNLERVIFRIGKTRELPPRDWPYVYFMYNDKLRGLVASLVSDHLTGAPAFRFTNGLSCVCSIKVLARVSGFAYH